jgi:hypothetical protein
MYFKKWALAIICCSLAIPALSEETYKKSYNSHISLNAGRSSASGACEYRYVSEDACSEKSTIFRMGYGYHFTPNWGIELSYGDFGRAKQEGMLAAPPVGVPGGGPIPYTWTWDAVGWEVAATGTLHFGDSFSLIGKVGYVYALVGHEAIVITTTNETWHAVLHEDNNRVSTAIGVQYDFNRDYGLRIQYENFGKLGKVTQIKTSATSACLILKF